MESLRRGLNSLSTNSELKNVVSEEEDVAKAYENIVKQKNEAVKFFGKYSQDEGQHSVALEIFNTVNKFNTDHGNIYKEFAVAYRNYISGLKEILSKHEKLVHEEKQVKELTEKVAKKKASQEALNSAKKTLETLEAEVTQFSNTKLKELTIQITKANLQFYNKGAQLMNSQLQALGVAPQGLPGAPPPGQIPPSGPLPGQFPQGGPPPGQFPQGQFQPGPYPPQGQFQQGGPPPQGQFQQGPYPPQGQFQQGGPPQGQFQPGPYPPQGQFQQGPPQGQFQPGPYPPQGQFQQGGPPPNQVPPNQVPPSQVPPNQVPPPSEAPPPSQAPQGEHPQSGEPPVQP